MEELRHKKPSTIVKIAADGDDFLVVGPEKVKLRVAQKFEHHLSLCTGILEIAVG